MIYITTNIVKIDTIKLIAYIADRIKNRILRNIKEGVNNNGQQLMPYSPGYAKKAGQRIPDFSDTGRMLSQLKAIVHSNYFEIGIMGNRADIANELNKRKNWTFLKWGVLLDEEYQQAMKDYFNQHFGAK